MTVRLLPLLQALVVSLSLSSSHPALGAPLASAVEAVGMTV